LHTIPSLVAGSAVPVNKHGMLGVSPGGVVPPVGDPSGWKQIGYTELASSNNEIVVSSIDNYPYLKVLIYVKGTTGSTDNVDVQFNGDSSGNYAFDYAINENATAQSINVTQGWKIKFNQLGGTPSEPVWCVLDIMNYATEEKLGMATSVTSANPNSASDAVQSQRTYAKWANTANVIDEIRVYHQNASTDLLAGSEVVVLGFDPSAPTGTNFFEELASVNLSGGASQTLDTPQFTPKKYLWVEWLSDDPKQAVHYGGQPETLIGSGGTILTASDYSFRTNKDNQSDTRTSQGRWGTWTGTSADSGDTFCNSYIVNPDGATKWIVQRSGGFGLPTSAVTYVAFQRLAGLCLQTNQIDIVRLTDVDAGAGVYQQTPSQMIVWGGDPS
tara:strand:+ start:25 stop:1182 length:1158 start_codon:yes stop_codon:yes gene_type:complete